MAGVQRLLATSNNVVPDAELDASAVRPAERSVFPVAAARTGNGAIALTGNYSGLNDTLLEIEIRPAGGVAARVTQPVFAGAGNGAMTPPVADDGTASQDVTVTLVDTGITTTVAQAILYADVLLRAQTAGAGGNSLTLSLTPILTLSAAPVGALGKALDRGTQEWPDPKLDFGAVPLNPDGTVPDAAPRLAFGRDTSQVYRHYKRWDGEQWQYGVSPKLQADYVVGAQVHEVTGTYTATVSDGVTTETYSDVTTLYDLLLALSASALIELDAPPANNRKPGGMAAVDVPFRTSAYALPVDKSREDMPDLAGLVVADTAPTEQLTLTCTDKGGMNAEVWTVKSQVYGDLAPAVTGVAYDGPYADFTIPKGTIAENPVAGAGAIASRTLQGTGAPKAYPDICLYRPTLGARAAAQTLTLVWTARAPVDCSCESSAVVGRPREEYLGIDLGDDVMVALAAGHQARLEELTSWHKAFVAGNTAVTAAGELRAADYDLKLAGLARDELASCLEDLYTNADAVLQASAWTASTAYARDAVVEPTARNNYRYRCTVAGTSHTSAPTWPTTIGNAVTDGGVTWKCVSKIPEIAWDDVLAGLDSDLTALETTYGPNAAAQYLLTVNWKPSTTYAKGDLLEPNTPNGYVYRCIEVGNSHATTEPNWPTTVGNTVVDNTITWKCEAALTAAQRIREINTTNSRTIAYTANDIVKLGTAYFKVVTTFSGGDFSTTPTPAWSDGGISYLTSSTGPLKLQGLTLNAALALLSDPPVVNQTVAAALTDANISTITPSSDAGIVYDPTTWSQRYLAACNYVRALAGLPPKADAGLSPTAGSGVWSDPGDAGYWAIEGNTYLPVFNNRYYHSCRLIICSDNREIIEPTYEFGFALRVGCPERLVAGDKITIAISVDARKNFYLPGDTYRIPVVMGRPLNFSGGVSGDDTLTWIVRSSTAGALDDYELDLAEDPYDDGGITFTINRGGIPFALGDAFTFAVEAGGQFRWRQDGGAWSADTAIADSVALADGLTATFVPGQAPGFVAGDGYAFRVLQPYSPAHVLDPHGETWAWPSTGATLTLTWATDQTVEVIGLLRHGLTAPAWVEVTLKDGLGATLFAWTPTVAPGPLVYVLPYVSHAVREMEIVTHDAAGMSLGWVYAGAPLGTAHNARVTLRRAYALDRDGGRNPRGAYLGVGRGGEIAWENWLLQDELDDLLALVDACKADGDAPLVLLPNIHAPQEAALVRVDGDAIEISDVFDYQPADTARRRLSLTLPLAPVYL